MTEDPRPDVPNVPVATAPVERFRGIPEPLSGQLSSVYNTVSALKEVVETLVGERGDESNAAILFRHLFPEGVAGDDAFLGDYYLRHDTHTNLTPPLYLEDPHQQYWHKVMDPAWAHMASGVADPDLVVEVGGVIQNYASKVIPDWQVTSDLAAGTMVFGDGSDGHSETGAYVLSLNGYVSGTSNSDNVITVYVDSVASGLHIPVILKGNEVTSAFAWSGVVDVSGVSTWDLRVSVGNQLTFHAINWSVHRISPKAGEVE